MLYAQRLIACRNSIMQFSHSLMPQTRTMTFSQQQKWLFPCVSLSCKKKGPLREVLSYSFPKVTKTFAFVQPKNVPQFLKILTNRLSLYRIAYRLRRRQNLWSSLRDSRACRFHAPLPLGNCSPRRIAHVLRGRPRRPCQ